MNKINKFIPHLRYTHWLSLNVSRYHCTVKKHEYSTRKFPLTCLSSCFETIRHVSNVNQTGLSNLVDTNDILLTSIKNAKQTSDVLQIIRLHKSVMTIEHNLQVLNTLFLLQKSKKTNMSKDELIRSPEFTLLCHKLQNHSRNLDLSNVMNSIKCLSYLGVSVKSNIMQMFLQLISKMINEMSLQQITFLHFLLKDLPLCPLVEALKLALPIVFEAQVQYKLDDNLYWQVDCLNYITKQRLSQETFDFVMSKIIKNIDQLNMITFKHLLLLLYFKDYSTEKYIYIINKYLKVYMNQTDFIGDIHYIEAALFRMLNKYLTDSKLFYNEYFINSVVEYLMKNQESFENIGYIVKKLNKISYVHRGLLDYMTDKLVNDTEMIEKTKFGVLLSYIAACANANYIPSGFIALKPYILNRFKIQKDVLQLPWLMVTFDLVVLDIWSDELLERVFSRDFLYEFMKRDDNVHDYIMLLKLYQATKTLYPGGYKGPLPPMEFIEKAISIYQHNVNDFPLKSALEYGLGGADYVLTGVRSKLGHFIDHVVVFRPGGFSVAINKELKGDKSILLENIKTNNNLLICILLYKPNNYVINLNTLRGPFALMNKTIEALDVKILSVSVDVWDSLIDYEKIPYIMRELQSIADINLVSEINLH